MKTNTQTFAKVVIALAGLEQVGASEQALKNRWSGAPWRSSASARRASSQSLPRAPPSPTCQSVPRASSARARELSPPGPRPHMSALRNGGAGAHARELRAAAPKPPLETVHHTSYSARQELVRVDYDPVLMMASSKGPELHLGEENVIVSVSALNGVEDLSREELNGTEEKKESIHSLTFESVKVTRVRGGDQRPFSLSMEEINKLKLKADASMSLAGLGEKLLRFILLPANCRSLYNGCGRIFNCAPPPCLVSVLKWAALVLGLSGMVCLLWVASGQSDSDEGEMCFALLEAFGAPFMLLVFVALMSKHLLKEMNGYADAGEATNFESLPRIGTVVVAMLGNGGKLFRVGFGILWNKTLPKYLKNHPLPWGMKMLGGYEHFFAAFFLSEALLLLVLYWNNLFVLARAGCDFSVWSFDSLANHNWAIFKDVFIKCMAGVFGSVMYQIAHGCGSYPAKWIKRMTNFQLVIFWSLTHLPIDLMQQSLTLNTAKYTAEWRKILVANKEITTKDPLIDGRIQRFGLCLYSACGRSRNCLYSACGRSRNFCQEASFCPCGKEAKEEVSSPASQRSPCAAGLQSAFVSLELYIADVFYVQELLRKDAPEHEKRGAIMLLARAVKIRKSLSEHNAMLKGLGWFCVVGWFLLWAYLIRKAYKAYQACRHGMTSDEWSQFTSDEWSQFQAYNTSHSHSHWTPSEWIQAWTQKQAYNASHPHSQSTVSGLIHDGGITLPLSTL